MLQTRISCKSLTGYRPKAAGKARTARKRIAMPKPRSARVRVMLMGMAPRSPAGAWAAAAPAASPERPPEESLRPEQHDERHHGIDDQHGDAGQPDLAERLGLADDQTPHERALEGAQAAHDHHD